MASKVNSVFITGANRGIGLRLLKEILLKFRPKVVFATYRNPATSQELTALADANKNVYLIEMDVVDYEKHAEVAKTVESVTGGAGLNLLLNNAGILLSAPLKRVSIQELRSNMEVNLFAPILLTQTLLPQLEKASLNAGSSPCGIGRAAIVNFSSELGSIGGNDTGGIYPYRCSKAALNSATKGMSVDLKRSKILSIALHPGWVQTDMGGPRATLTVDQSVEGIMNVLEHLNESQNGKFIAWDGKELPW
ncbi:unnamed protein product [Allacma fusca]|uniref:C-factor n=1 Tax=Allacma fusca TaxID=39272 RepID=A0A8J2PPU0_9HEXA|nr:unnamed protein product [Allacma fusca]